VAESGLPYYKELAETNLLRAAVGNIGSGKDTGTALLNLVLDEYNRQGFKRYNHKICHIKKILEVKCPSNNCL
jgi:hypothetical protein